MRRYFTTKVGNAVHAIQLKSTAVTDVKPNPYINFMPKIKLHPVTKKPAVPWQKLPHVRTDKLPLNATDILGVDTAAHLIFPRKAVFGKIPVLFKSKFFVLTFIPHMHVISTLRKSNVAYTFTNYGCAMLNDQNLHDNFKKYRGKYQALLFFQEIHSPMGSAVARSKFRKYVKRALYMALHKAVPNTPESVDKISGIFHFKFLTYPTYDARAELKTDMRLAITKLYTDDKFQRSLASISRQQNSTFPNIWKLVRDVKTENIVGADTTPGYCPKLPFLDSRPARRSNR